MYAKYATHQERRSRLSLALYLRLSGKPSLMSILSCYLTHISHPMSFPCDIRARSGETATLLKTWSDDSCCKGDGATLSISYCDDARLWGPIYHLTKSGRMSQRMITKDEDVFETN